MSARASCLESNESWLFMLGGYMQKNEQKTSKTWNTPQLTAYGTIEELTAGSGGPYKTGGQGDSLVSDQLSPWTSCSPCCN